MSPTQALLRHRSAELGFCAGRRLQLHHRAGRGVATVVYKNTVTVQVTQHPLPTAQITIFAHVDHNPINNTWDEYDGGLSGEAIPTRRR